MTYRFMVTSGAHIDNLGRVFKKGEIVESDKELDKVEAFKDRFKRVTGGGPEEVGVSPGPMAPQEEENARARAENAKLREMPKAVEDVASGLKAVKPHSGMPADKAGRPTDPDERHRVGDDKPTKASSTEEDKSPAQKKAQSLGDDVTHKYPSAKKKGLTIHLTEEGDYQVAHKGTVLEGGEALSRSKVRNFIKRHKEK